MSRPGRLWTRHATRAAPPPALAHAPAVLAARWQRHVAAHNTFVRYARVVRLLDVGTAAAVAAALAALELPDLFVALVVAVTGTTLVRVGATDAVDVRRGRPLPGAPLDVLRRRLDVPPLALLDAATTDAHALAIVLGYNNVKDE